MSSDLADETRETISEIIVRSCRSRKGGQPRNVNIREVVNTICLHEAFVFGRGGAAEHFVRTVGSCQLFLRRGKEPVDLFDVDRWMILADWNGDHVGGDTVGTVSVDRFYADSKALLHSIDHCDQLILLARKEAPPGIAVGNDQPDAASATKARPLDPSGCGDAVDGARAW